MYTPANEVKGVYWNHPVRLSICPSVCHVFLILLYIFALNFSFLRIWLWVLYRFEIRFWKFHLNHRGQSVKKKNSSKNSSRTFYIISKSPFWLWLEVSWRFLLKKKTAVPKTPCTFFFTIAASHEHFYKSK